MELIIEREHDTLIKLTDDMIKDVGYKTKKNKGNDRTNLFHTVIHFDWTLLTKSVPVFSTS